MKTKIAVLLTGLMIATALVVDYLLLSRTGTPSGWVVYLGLPITAGGVLLALRLADLGTGWDAKTRQRQAAQVPMPHSGR